MTKDDRDRPVQESGREKPEGSQIEGEQSSGHEPEGATVTPAEDSSGSGVGEATWECLTCGRVYDEDHGKCPDDDAPLRKVGPHATPQASKIAFSTENIERPASNPNDTPEGFDGADDATRGKEPPTSQF